MSIQTAVGMAIGLILGLHETSILSDCHGSSIDRESASAKMGCLTGRRGIPQLDG